MKDRIVQYPLRYELTLVSGNIYELTQVPGTITEVGTDLNKASLLSDATSTALGMTGDKTVNDALAAISILNAIKFYGKYSQASGGDGKTGSAQSGIITFSTEDKDDFAAINLGASSSKIIIPAGVSLAKFYFKGALSLPPGYAGTWTISLYKNGSSTQILSSVYSLDSGIDSTATFFSTPVVTSVNNEFQLYATLTTTSTTHHSILGAGSIFGMEVLG